MKKVFKYGTGQSIPDGAIYLRTVVEIKKDPIGIAEDKRFVWHYFLIETEATDE